MSSDLFLYGLIGLEFLFVAVYLAAAKHERKSFYGRSESES